MQDLLKTNTRFALTFDEWTSGRNRRFLNLVLHHGVSNILNLGLNRRTGKATGENLSIVKSEIEKFGLDFSKHIVCIMTDGCPTMTKLGRLADPVPQQLCYAHALQLSVLDVLYVNKKDQKDGEEDLEELFTDDEKSDQESDEKHDPELDCDLRVNSQPEFPFKYREDIHKMIKKVRSISKHFRMSPLANEGLQHHVLKFHDKELQLIMNVRTRWSSMFAMLERFSFLHPCIKKALKDEKKEDLLKDIDFEFLDELIDALRPLEYLTRKLCQRDANLFTTDAVFSVALNKLLQLDTRTSNTLYNSIFKRLSERRTIISDVLYYLHTGKLERGPTFAFNMSDRLSILNFMKKLVCRLTSGVEQNQDDQVNSEDCEEPPIEPVQTMEEEMELELKRMLQTSPSIIANKPLTLLQKIKREMELFEDGGTLGKNLQFVYDVLSIVKPTSVESERVFSSSETFVLVV